MSGPLFYLLLTLSLSVCAVSIFFIVKYYRTLARVQQEQQLQADKTAERFVVTRNSHIESIQVIAQALGNDEKLTITEACIRLEVLLNRISDQLLHKPELQVIQTVAELTRHIPIKDKWKELDKQQRWKYLQEMKCIEQRHETDVAKATEFLVNYDFSLQVH